MKRTDRLIAASRGTTTQVAAYATKQGAKRIPYLMEYLQELRRLCDAHGYDAAILASQSANETGNWTADPGWSYYGNPAGIGITGVTGGAAGPNVSLVYKNGRDAARAHLVHMYAYTRGRIPAGHDLEQYIPLDPRYNAVFQNNDVENGEPLAASVQTIGDFNVSGRWAIVATPPPYGDRIINRGNEIFPGLEQGPVKPEEPTVPNVYRRVPHPPFTDLPVSKPSGGGFGYTQIPTNSRDIVGVMNHETVGHGSGPWYRDFFSCPAGERCSDALVDYLIQRDGAIFRLNDPHNNRSPWANGGPLGLEGDGPAFYARFGATGINNSLISIEYEKFDEEDYTPAQVQSGGLLNAYWHDQDSQPWESYPYADKYGCVTSLAHFEIGTTNCGKGELDDIEKVQAVAKGEMKKWQTNSDAPTVPVPPEVPPQPENPPLPGGISVKEATKRFGKLTKHLPDGTTKVAPFDPRGVISLSWCHRCAATGEWPKAEDWWALSDSGKTLDIITFSNDWQLIRTADRQGLMWARFADAELEEDIRA